MWKHWQMEKQLIQYNNATYDAEKPKAVKCGIPCTLEPLNIDFWQSTSWCIG